MKKLSEMTLKEKLGQLVMCGFEDDYYDEHIKTLVEEYKVANVIYFARNVKNIRQLAELNKKVYSEIIKHTGTIPFVGIDQEGGMVTRIMDGATFAPGSMTISATNNPNNAYKIGEIMGEELAVLGINFNLAPSLDTNNNPANPVIGVRSYSDDPEMVGLYGNCYIKGLQSKGVLATAKHFPGHGDTKADTHFGYANSQKTWAEMLTCEMVTFKAGIQWGCQLIMTAHIAAPNVIGSDIPSTMSPVILQDKLRKELGYQNIIISDAMEMGAITQQYSNKEAAVGCIKAGVDIVLGPQNFVEAFDAVVAAVNNGTLSEERINQSVRRILKLKQSLKN